MAGSVEVVYSPSASLWICSTIRTAGLDVPLLVKCGDVWRHKTEMASGCWGMG